MIITSICSSPLQVEHELAIRNAKNLAKWRVKFIEYNFQHSLHPEHVEEIGEPRSVKIKPNQYKRLIAA